MMMYSDFDEEVFKDSVREALLSVQRVLDIDRSPNLRLAEDVDHEYTDKYKLANLLTNTAIISFMVVLDGLGLTKDVLRSIGTDNNKASKATTLRCSFSESCTFVKEETVDVPLPSSKEIKEVTTKLKEFGTDESSTTKSTIETIVNRVTRQHYTIETNWEISIYYGTDIDNRRVIEKRTGTKFDFVRDLPNISLYDAKDSKKDHSYRKAPPFPPRSNIDPVELSLTWLLQQIDTEELKSHFAIDTSISSSAENNTTQTQTPRRNLQIEQALSFFRSVTDWTHTVQTRFVLDYPNYIFSSGDGGIDDRSQQQGCTNIQALNSNGIFVPIIPLLEDKRREREGRITQNGYAALCDEQEDEDMDAEPESKAVVALSQSGNEDTDTNNLDNIETDSPKVPSPILSVPDTTRFVNEQVRTLCEEQKKLQRDYPDPKTTTELISVAEANVCLLCLHAQELVDRYAQSIEYIECMLEKQLVAAIGKKVTSSDLDKFMRYHNDKMLNPGPKPFCYTIRRPEHYPDGILSIEKLNLDSSGYVGYEPIYTHVRELTFMPPVKIPLNAATTLELTGKTYLHGWLNHGFGDANLKDPLRLNARARQFSSFVLMVGTMASQNRMEPKDAIILRNKDELNIPLLLNEIPTATEFKDAIGSLSPEQQRFAKAFRSMQLESSVLGICVIQIKPQLEKLLGLPRDSLTKEMKLTEDLTEMFVEHQVPSDLVSYDGDMAMNCNEGESKSESIKDQVANVKEHVKSVLDVIAAQKKEQLEEQTRKADMAWEREASKGLPHPVCASAAPAMAGRKARSRMPQTSSIPIARGYSGGQRRLSKCATSEPAIKCFAMSAEVETLLCDEEAHDEPTNSAETSFKTEVSECNVAKPSLKNGAIDFTAMPKVLDRAIELNDKDASIRSTTIKTAKDGWTRLRQPNLLTKAKTSSLGTTEIVSEKNKAFDLLDALSRSGSLEIPFSELHILLCATHRFEKNVMETVIQDNINPIEKLEMSTLLMASTILNVPARHLISNEKKRKQLAESFPQLVNTADADDSLHESTSVVSSSTTSVTTANTLLAKNTVIDENTAAEI
mmetsp:Transcript_7958/g.17100  ORF Transcript_7958/g.17100 Transcript_7958/m.17100 type:complete len:1072 (-) Transcript_7958:276-3491(-)